MTKYFDVCSLLTQDIDRIMLLHGARVMESVKPILDSETRTEDVKEQVKHNAASLLLPNKSPEKKAKLVSPRNDAWETSAEIPYWQRVTSNIWVVLLIESLSEKNFPRGTTNQNNYQDLR